MIKYNNNTINEWYFDESNIVKVYRNNAICYYKITVGGGQVPCYAVVDDISQYSDTEFEDVFNKADGKWYKLNNLSQYEEYGVYGSGRTITYYEGKLTIDDGYEYAYSGSSWVNVGEVSGSTRVPAGYTEVEYIQNTSSAYINTEFINTKNTEFELDFQITDGVSEDRKIIGQGFKFGLGQEQSKWRIVDSAWYRTSVSIDTNRHIAHTDTGKYYIDETLIADRYSNKTEGTYSMLLFAVSSRYSISPDGNCALMKMYNCKIYDNGTLVRDFVPCTRDSDSVAGVYDMVNNGFYTSVNSSYSFIAGAETGSTVYPLYYDEKSDPPNNLSFSSMTEAESYECPWVGMKATIDGDKYVFSGDSQSGYEWVYQALPYTMIEYVETPSTSPYAGIELLAVPSSISTPMYYNLDFMVSTAVDQRVLDINRNSRFVTYSSYPLIDNQGSRYFTMSYTDIPLSTRNKIGFGIYSGDSQYEVRNLETDTRITSRNASVTNSLIPAVCAADYSSNVSGNTSVSEASSKGIRYYGIKIYDNNVLVGDYIPVIRDSDNVVTMYDLVTQEFCNIIGSGTLIAGSPI